MRDATAYKVLTADELAELEGGGFAGSAVDRRDGYIHLSTAAQLTETVDKHYGDRGDLHVAEVDLAALGDAIRWEPSRGGEDFPHLYAPLPLDTVVAYSPLQRDDTGQVLLPVAG